MRFVHPRKPAASTGPRPYVFSMEKRERMALLSILNMYPVLEPSHHRISQKPRAAEQQWLEETMKQQKEEHKQKLAQLFLDDGRFFKEGKEDVRLLRVLNDIRVGSWVRLGQPEMEEARHFATKSGRTHFLTAMELSGYFQAVLLQAFS